MDSAALAQALWADIGAQRWDALAAYFLPGALIFWHNTDECFTVEEFVRANREYPGNWRIEIERVHALADAAATAERVYGPDGTSFHAASFFTFRHGKIVRLDEYWGDDGPAPEWRRALGIGRPIQREDRYGGE